jgi:hypothetical protein
LLVDDRDASSIIDSRRATSERVFSSIAFVCSRTAAV